jgi:hypothetical protein
MKFMFRFFLFCAAGIGVGVSSFGSMANKPRQATSEAELMSFIISSDCIAIYRLQKSNVALVRSIKGEHLAINPMPYSTRFGKQGDFLLYVYRDFGAPSGKAYFHWSGIYNGKASFFVYPQKGNPICISVRISKIERAVANAHGKPPSPEYFR